MRVNTKKVRILLFTSLVVAVILLLGIYSFPNFFFLNNHNKETCSNYEKEKRIVIVKCNSTLGDVWGTVSDDSVLKKESTDGTWFLNASLVVLKNATLSINPSEAKWIKISSHGTSFGVRKLVSTNQGSNEPTPYAIQVFGSLDIDGVKVTSWDPETNNFTNQVLDGLTPRPYIAIQDGADSTHITNSEIAYLGYNDSRKQGLNFYGGDNSTLTGNRIHDLWYGFISVNVGHVRIENNTVYNNFRYGIDPHMNSHDMIIRNNHIYDNRIGLICSLQCANVIFEKNTIANNNEIGLMFSRNTVNSIARNNNISSSDTGISISGSHLNKVYGNNLFDNNISLAIKDNSSNNFLFNNSIYQSRNCGILVDESLNNTIEENHIEKYYASGICLTGGAIQNIFYANEIDGLGKYGIDVRDGARVNSFFRNIIHLADNAIRIYNNTETLFAENRIGTTKGHEYLISGNSILNLVKTQFLGDTIRAAGRQPNVVKIWNSGTINIVSKPTGNSTEIIAHDTDEYPYLTKLTYDTIKIYSKAK